MVVATHFSPLLTIIAILFTLVAVRLAHHVFAWHGPRPHFLQRFVAYMWVTFSAWAIFTWTLLAIGDDSSTESVWNSWGIALMVPIVLAGLLLDHALMHVPSAQGDSESQGKDG